MLSRFVLIFSFVTVVMIGCTGQPQVVEPLWLISANDQRFSMCENRIMDQPRPGSLIIMDVSGNPLRSVETLEDVSCSLIGPPTCVAITPNQKLALVAGSQKLDASEKSKQVPSQLLSVIKLEQGAHHVSQVLTLGNQVSGVEINRSGNRALVTNRADGSISLLAINDSDQVILLDTFQIADAKSSVSHAAFSPDGQKVLATLHKENKVYLLSLVSDQLTVVATIEVDHGPYCIEFLPSGQFAAVAHTGSGSIMLLEVKDNTLRLVDTIPVGITAEGLDISPDGEWMVVNCLDNSFMDETKLKSRKSGLLVLLQKQGQTFVTVDVVRTGRNPQAARFTHDSNYVAVGNNGDQNIVFYQIVNEKLHQTEIRLDCAGGPAAMRISD
ncbi:YncE family protein [Poriferisphaera sp. WC338]|uniref:YncE family protein n=1 Tax=Poriferisphaera sp. WC338 TaxID=3425129 RepID=UPI003D813E6C